MFAFKLTRAVVKHQLVTRKRDRLAAVVFDRILPTKPTEHGRIALVPKSALPWARALGLPLKPAKAFQ